MRRKVIDFTSMVKTGRTERGATPGSKISDYIKVRFNPERVDAMIIKYNLGLIPRGERKSFSIL